MTYWQKRIHLFMGGKFGASWAGAWWKVQGLNPMTGWVYLMEVGSPSLTRDIRSVQKSSFKLIARTFNSMSDEEWVRYNRTLGGGVETMDTFVFYLEEGIFPWDWPSDGSVIDKSTIPENIQLELR